MEPKFIKCPQIKGNVFGKVVLHPPGKLTGGMYPTGGILVGWTCNRPSPDQPPLWV